MRLEADARLAALAPDLARLCAELGEALEDVIQTYIDDVCPDEEQLASYVAAWRATLTQLAELEAR